MHPLGEDKFPALRSNRGCRGLLLIFLTEPEEADQAPDGEVDSRKGHEPGETTEREECGQTRSSHQGDDPDHRGDSSEEAGERSRSTRTSSLAGEDVGYTNRGSDRSSKTTSKTGAEALDTRDDRHLFELSMRE